MEENVANESPIACDLTAIDAAQRERHQTKARALFAAVQEVKELPDGYTFRLPAEPAFILKVAEYISLERLCCPFFNFALELEPEGGLLWLKLTGREGVKEFLRAEFGRSEALE
jgi:hypothetical protein